MMISRDVAELLESETRRINRVEFIENDPVQFPRRFSKLQDVEIAAFLAATIAWGNRKMICRDADRMLSLMDHDPYNYVMDRGYEDLDPAMNIHRTFFARNLQHYLRGLHRIYADYGSIDAFATAMHVGDDEAPSWRLVAEMQKVLAAENGGEADSRCLPGNLKQTALKRINMALRWLVRDDGIVDMGLWKSIPKSKLFIPLDVHSGNTSRDLGLLTRRANDRRAVEELTAACRILDASDPAKYDFALFGIGIGE